MPKLIPEEVRLKAMDLYLQGNLPAIEIAKQVSDEFDVGVQPSTVYAWAKRFAWDDQKNQARTEAMEQVKESERTRFMRVQQEQLQNYEEMRHKATHELDGLQFDRAIDAVRAADLSIQGERQIMQGMMNLTFVQEVLSIILEEVGEQTTIDRIATRLRGLISED